MMKIADQRAATLALFLFPCWLLASTGCAEDGCDTIKGKYRAKYTLSSGPCAARKEMIVDLEGTSLGTEEGCTITQTKTAGTNTCKLDVRMTCKDGGSTGVISCEGDGETCGVTTSFTAANGDSCIYDGTLTRL